MPKRVLPLVAKVIDGAKPKDKPYKLTDGEGLHLLITPTGGKLWRMQYWFDGKQKQLAFGAYPAVSLADARKKRTDAKEMIASGIDPAAQKPDARIKKQADDFETVFRRWFSIFAPTIWNGKTANKVITRFERGIFPYIGKVPISELEAPKLLEVLQKMQGAGEADKAHRCRGHAAQMFGWAIQSGLCSRNPAAALIGALPPVKNNHYPTFTEPKDVARLIRDIYAYSGSAIVSAAIKLAVLTFARPGEIRGARWEEFDLDNALWTIPGWRMKMKESHLVPLSKQAIEVLRQVRPYSDHSEFVFRSVRTPLKPISDNTVNAALRSLGYTGDEIVGHGFRAMARTMLHERLKCAPDWIEAQLAHAVPDRLGRTYNRAQHLDDRIKMMQMWADYLDGLCTAK